MSAGENQAEDFQDLQAKLNSCNSVEETIITLAKSPFIVSKFRSMERSSILEEMLSMGRSYNAGPLNSFPPSVNKNLYADVVRYGLEYAPRLMSLLVDLHVDRDKCIIPENIKQR